MFKKLSQLKFKSFRRQYMFLFMAFAMCVLVGGFTIYSILFIASNIESSLSVQPPVPSPVKFDIEGFNNLKLTR